MLYYIISYLRFPNKILQKTASFCNIFYFYAVFDGFKRVFCKKSTKSPFFVFVGFPFDITAFVVYNLTCAENECAANDYDKEEWL